MKRQLGEAAARLILSAVSPLARQLAEVGALTNLQFNLQISGYRHALFPGGYAARATLMLDLFRLLVNRRPKAILECGTGESTGLLIHYAQRNPGAHIVSLEDHQQWSEVVLNRFCSEGTPSNFQLICAPLGHVGDRYGEQRIWYDDAAVIRAMADRVYEVVLIDGPSGRLPGGRGGILNYLPDILADEFVIYFDDAASSLFREEVQTIRKILLAAGRKFVCRNLFGEKDVCIFVTPGLVEFVGGQIIEEHNIQ